MISATQKVLALSALTLAVTNALAFEQQAVFAPKTLFSFSGTLAGAAEGARGGSQPFSAPVYVAQEKRLYGVARKGGATYTYTGSFGSLDNEAAVLYGVAADGAAYVGTDLGAAIGSPVTPLLLDATRGVLYGGSLYGVAGQTGGGVLFKVDKGAVSVLATEADGLPHTNFDPRGQLAFDGSGTLLMGGSNGTASCTNSDGTPNLTTRAVNNLLLRLDLASSLLSPRVHFCDFVNRSQVALNPARPTSLTTYHEHTKGSVPRHLVWSADDGGTLYAVATSSGSLPEIAGVPSNDDSGKPSAALIRIKGADLATALTAADADKIEVLHRFGRLRDGVPRAGVDQNNALIEDGDWLYGTTYSTGAAVQAAGGIVWRFNKKQADSFKVLHRFGNQTDAGGARSGIEGDGSNPAGQLALAADGNLYGTAYNDIRPAFLSGNNPAGPGIVFRLKIDRASADRAGDAYEPLHYFDAATTGARPVGLTVGEIAGTEAAPVQRLYGATQFGGAAGNTPSNGNGTVFSIDVPLPPVALTAFSASATAVTVGDRPTLTWSTNGADTCTASGDWSGAKAASGTEQLPVLATVGTQTFTLACASHAGVVTPPQTVTITVAAAPTPAPAGDSGGGGAAGLAALAGLVLALRRRVRA